MVEERESCSFTDEELEEIARVVCRDRVGRGGRVVFEVGFGFGFLSGELEFELVVDVDLDVDLVGQRLLEFDLPVDFNHGRSLDQTAEPDLFCDAPADMRSRLS